MKKYILLLLVSSVFILRCGPGEQPVTLVSPTQYCTIVTDLGDYKNAVSASEAAASLNWDSTEAPENQACIHAWAALELQKYLADILVLEPAELPIVDDDIPTDGPIIFIGTPRNTGKWETLHKKLKKRWKRSKSEYHNGFRLDTFSFKEAPGCLVLSGETPVAALYAVYEFLDRTGVRWISPDETGEIVPNQGGLVVQPLSRFIVPQMRFRGFLYDYVGKVPANQNVTPEFLIWMARNRLNMVKESDSLAYLYKKLGISTCNGDEKFNQTPLNPWAMDPNANQNAAGQMTYLESHPEWYKINPGGSEQPAPVLCVSQIDMVKELVNQIKANWQHLDYITVYNIQNLPWCNCSACSQLGNNTNKFLSLLNQVENRLQDDNDPQVMGVLGEQTLEPPQNPLPDNFNYDRVHLFFSPQKRCYNHAIDDPVCSDVNAGFVRLLNAWRSRNSNFQGKLNICELYNNRHFQNLPVVFTSVMNQDLQSYHKMDINGLCIQNPSLTSGGVQSMMNYQLSRGAWRNNVDLDSLKIEYIVNQYPGSYQLMQEYYQKLEEAMANISAWKWELPERVNHVVLDSTLDSILPLGAFAKHFNLDEEGTQPLLGTHWERTYQLIYEVQYILFEALTSDVPPLTRKRLMELNEYKKYSELVINLNDNILRALTLGQSEPEMRIEALIRLESVAAELQSFTITEPAFGLANGLEASGIGDAVLKILQDNKALIDQYKTP